MPITKAAIKKQRADKAKTQVNRVIMSRVKSAEKAAVTQPTPAALAAVFSAVDVAVKKHVLKLNTASRIKARITRSLKTKFATSPFAKAKAK